VRRVARADESLKRRCAAFRRAAVPHQPRWRSGAGWVLSPTPSRTRASASHSICGRDQAARRGCHEASPPLGGMARVMDVSITIEKSRDYFRLIIEVRFENLVALHLLKLVDAWNDYGYGDYAFALCPRQGEARGRLPGHGSPPTCAAGRSQAFRQRAESGLALFRRAATPQVGDPGRAPWPHADLGSDPRLACRAFFWPGSDARYSDIG